MIVCSCNRLNDQQISCAARQCGRGRACEPTPSAVFRALNCRANCARCYPLVIEVVDTALARAPLTVNDSGLAAPLPSPTMT